jgi:NADH oxidase (H2O2-forming)
VVAGLATVDAITNPDQMFTNAGIKVILGKVVQADPVGKTLTLADGARVSYDKLILGTGASQTMLPIPGNDLRGVFTLRDAQDAINLRNFLETARPQKSVFIGAGFINLELACLLLTTAPDRYQATVIEVLDHVLPLMLDREMAAGVQDYLVEKGCGLQVGQKVVRILGSEGRVTGVELASGDKLEADLVMVAVGATPNLELAQQLGLQLGKFGIKVNRFLETSNPDILAGGDCVEKENFITKKPVPGQTRGPAVIQGRLAAKRLAGYAIEFPGVLNNTAVKLFDKYIASVGLTETAARQEGLDPISAAATSRSKHGMIPGVKPWTLKLIFQQSDQRLIGGQLVSDSEAPVKEIDTINALILGGKTVADLTQLMCAGNPDCSSEPSLEPITICAEQALQKLSK